MKPRRTLADWQAVQTSNPLALQIDDARSRLRDVMLGRHHFMILTGGAGAGKSWIINQAIEDSGRGALKVEVGHYKELHSLFRKAVTGGRLPLIFEEADNLFSSERQANTLKKATDTNVSNRSVEVEEVVEVVSSLTGKPVRRKMPRVIDLNCPVVVTSNNNINDLNSFDRRIRVHIEALKSRAGGQAIHIEASIEEQWEYTCYLAVCHGLIRTVVRLTRREEAFRSDATHALQLSHLGDDRLEWFPALEPRPIPVQSTLQNAALRWFTTNLYRLRDAYPRTLVEVMKTIVHNPNGWRAKMATFLADPSQPDFRPPEGAYPHIYQSRPGFDWIEGEQVPRRTAPPSPSPPAAPTTAATPRENIARETAALHAERPYVD